MAAAPPDTFSCFARDLRGELPECLSDLINAPAADPIELTAQLLRKTKDSKRYKEDKYSTCALIDTANRNVSEDKDFRCHELADMRLKVDILHNILNQKTTKRKSKDEAIKMDNMMARFRVRRQEVWGQELQDRIDRGELKLPGVHIVKRNKGGQKSPIIESESSASLIFEFDDAGRPITLKRLKTLIDKKSTKGDIKKIVTTQLAELAINLKSTEQDVAAMHRMVDLLKLHDDVNKEIMMELAQLMKDFNHEYKRIPDGEKESALIPIHIPTAYEGLNQDVYKERPVIGRLHKLQRKGCIRRNIRFLDMLDITLASRRHSNDMVKNTLSEEMHDAIQEAHQIMDTDVAIEQLTTMEKSESLDFNERREATLLKQVLEHTKKEIAGSKTFDKFRGVLDKLFRCIAVRLHVGETDEGDKQSDNNNIQQSYNTKPNIQATFNLEVPGPALHRTLMDDFKTLIDEEGGDLAILLGEPGTREEGEGEEDEEKEGGEDVVNKRVPARKKSNVFVEFHNLIASYKKNSLQANKSVSDSIMGEESEKDDSDEEEEDEEEEEEEVEVRPRSPKKSIRMISDMRHTMLSDTPPMEKFKHKASLISLLLPLGHHHDNQHVEEKKALGRTELMTKETYDTIKKGWKEHKQKELDRLKGNTMFGVHDTHNFIVDGNQLKANTSVGVINVNMRSNTALDAETPALKTDEDKLNCWTEYHPDIYTVCDVEDENEDKETTDEPQGNISTMSIEEFLPGHKDNPHSHRSASLTLEFGRSNMSFVNKKAPNNFLSSEINSTSSILSNTILSLGHELAGYDKRESSDFGRIEKDQAAEHSRKLSILSNSRKLSIQNSRRLSIDQGGHNNTASEGRTVPMATQAGQTASASVLHGATEYRQRESADERSRNNNNASSKDISMQMLQYMRL